jgi:hypothetical protein
MPWRLAAHARRIQTLPREPKPLILDNVAAGLSRGPASRKSDIRRCIEGQIECHIDIRIGLLVFSDWTGDSPMQYRQFEEALISTLGIEEDHLSAFRARLRHLRKLHIPNVPKRGSGNTAIYRKEDVFSTFVALALQTLGSSPTVSAIISRFATRFTDSFETFEKELFLIVTNVPAFDEKNLDGSAMPPIESLGFSWINTSVSARILACVVLGQEAAGRFATQPNMIATAVINLSARFKALPNES